MNNYMVDRKRWLATDIFQQMGNVYAEVGRTVRAYKSADQTRFEAALTRAVDLFDATIEAHSTSRYRVSEILRARSQFLSLFYGKTRSEDWDSLENYFMQFAVAARLRQFK